MLKKTILLCLILLLFLSFFALAQEETQEKKPEELLITRLSLIFRNWQEKIQLFFIFNVKKKINFLLEKAEEKIQELKQLQKEEKKDLAKIVLENYQKDLEGVYQNLKKIEEKGEAEEISGQVLEVTKKHFEVLAELYEEAPPEIKEKITKTITLSQKSFTLAKEIMSGERREEVQKTAQEAKNWLKINFKKIFQILWPIK